MQGCWQAAVMTASCGYGIGRLANACEVLRAERRYERLDITSATGITDTLRSTLRALGAIDRAGAYRQQRGPGRG
jgi:hypothetical protein